MRKDLITERFDFEGKRSRQEHEEISSGRDRKRESPRPHEDSIPGSSSSRKRLRDRDEESPSREKRERKNRQLETSPSDFTRDQYERNRKKHDHSNTPGPERAAPIQSTRRYPDSRHQEGTVGNVRGQDRIERRDNTKEKINIKDFLTEHEKDGLPHLEKTTSKFYEIYYSVAQREMGNDLAKIVINMCKEGKADEEIENKLNSVRKSEYYQNVFPFGKYRRTFELYKSDFRKILKYFLFNHEYRAKIAYNKHNSHFYGIYYTRAKQIQAFELSKRILDGYHQKENEDKIIKEINNMRISDDYISAFKLNDSRKYIYHDKNIESKLYSQLKKYEYESYYAYTNLDGIDYDSIKLEKLRLLVETIDDMRKENKSFKEITDELYNIRNSSEYKRAFRTKDHKKDIHNDPRTQQVPKEASFSKRQETNLTPGQSQRPGKDLDLSTTHEPQETAPIRPPYQDSDSRGQEDTLSKSIQKSQIKQDQKEIAQKKEMQDQADSDIQQAKKDDSSRKRQRTASPTSKKPHEATELEIALPTSPKPEPRVDVLSSSKPHETAEQGIDSPPSQNSFCAAEQGINKSSVDVQKFLTPYENMLCESYDPRNLNPPNEQVLARILRNIAYRALQGEISYEKAIEEIDVCRKILFEIDLSYDQ
jgi:hypothetical protein